MPKPAFRHNFFELNFTGLDERAGRFGRWQREGERMCRNRAGPGWPVGDPFMDWRIRTKDQPVVTSAFALLRRDESGFWTAEGLRS